MERPGSSSGTRVRAIAAVLISHTAKVITLLSSALDFLSAAVNQLGCVGLDKCLSRSKSNAWLVYKHLVTRNNKLGKYKRSDLDK